MGSIERPGRKITERGLIGKPILQPAECSLRQLMTLAGREHLFQLLFSELEAYETEVLFCPYPLPPLLL